MPEIPTRPVREAIFARRSIRKFAARPVDRATISHLLDAATQAPNHRLTRPWRFFVVDRSCEMRQHLSRLAGDIVLRAVQGEPDDVTRARAAAKREEVLNVPVLIFAFSTPGRQAEETRENYAAVACALQNLQLAAFEEGLVCGWSTGGIANGASLKELLGADEAWDVVGALYMGYPSAEASPVTRERPGAAAYTRWFD